MSEVADTAPLGMLAKDADLHYEAAYSGVRSMRNRIRLWLFNPEFRCVASYRLRLAAQDLVARKKLLGLIPLALSVALRHRIVTRRHVYISRNSEIGPGLLIMHGYGIMVGPSKIGSNCVLHQNVTIGDQVAAGSNRVPRIGNNVWIGPGATITGDITLGDNVTVSAGTVMSKSVPDGCLVAGNPGRVVRRDYDNRAIMGHRVEQEWRPNSAESGTQEEIVNGSSMDPARRVS